MMKHGYLGKMTNLQIFSVKKPSNSLSEQLMAKQGIAEFVLALLRHYDCFPLRNATLISQLVMLIYLSSRVCKLYFFFPACTCDGIGAFHNVCNHVTGDCVCKPYVTGMNCSACQVRNR